MCGGQRDRSKSNLVSWLRQTTLLIRHPSIPCWCALLPGSGSTDCRTWGQSEVIYCHLSLMVFSFREQQQKKTLFVSIHLQGIKNIVASKPARIIPRKFLVLFYIVLKFVLYTVIEIVGLCLFLTR